MAEYQKDGAEFATSGIVNPPRYNVETMENRETVLRGNPNKDAIPENAVLYGIKDTVGGDFLKNSDGTYVFYLSQMAAEAEAEQLNEEVQRVSGRMSVEYESLDSVQAKTKLQRQKELLGNDASIAAYEIFKDPTGAKMTNWLTACANLHPNNLSFKNAMLVTAQNPGSTYVMGYDEWSGTGRQVKKGAKGIKVFTPIYAKNYGENGLFNHITKMLTEKLKNEPDKPASYKLGQSDYRFIMQPAGKMSLAVGDKEPLEFSDAGHCRNYINKYILGKVPVSMSVGTVFDIADTYNKEKEPQPINTGIKLAKGDGEKLELLFSVLQKVFGNEPLEAGNKNVDMTAMPAYDKVSFAFERLAAQNSALKETVHTDMMGVIHEMCVAEMTAKVFGVDTHENDKSIYEMLPDWRKDKRQAQIEEVLEGIFKESKTLLRKIEKELDVRGLDMNLEPKTEKAMTENEKAAFIKKTQKNADERLEVCEALKKGLEEDYADAPAAGKEMIKEQGYTVKDIEAKLNEVNGYLDKLREPVKPSVENGLVAKIENALNNIAESERKLSEASLKREAPVNEEQKTLEEWKESMDKLEQGENPGGAHDTHNKEIQNKAENESEKSSR